MYWLPGQQKEVELLWMKAQEEIIYWERKFRRRAIRRWFLIALILGIIGGYCWSTVVNLVPLYDQVRKQRALIEELKKGYVPPHPPGQSNKGIVG